MISWDRDPVGTVQRRLFWLTSKELLFSRSVMSYIL